MALRLTDGVERLPGIGPARAERLARLGIVTVQDLLSWYPRDYEDRRTASSIAQAPLGQPVCVTAMVAEPPRLSRVRRGLELVKAKAVDDTGVLELTFFNQSYVERALRPGESYVFYGRMEGGLLTRRMTNPTFEQESRQRFTGRIMPVYPLTAGISNNLIAGWVMRGLADCREQLEEDLPEDIRLAFGLAQVGFACETVHFPPDWQALELARNRLVFEELFFLSVGLALLKNRRDGAAGVSCTPAPLEEFCAGLPFSLTGAQRRVIGEAAADLCSGRPMNRLVQGDVGAGKTVVAAACAWMMFRSGWQSALMAPTEILAEQHHKTLTGLLAPFGMRVGLLTGGLKATERRRVLKQLAAGELDLLVGTHALLSQGVDFARLGLVITDEQHRFGVAQRAALTAQGGEAGAPPHVLVMSATPIPRTLALIIYGDLDVSVVDELPPGRLPVATFLVGEDKRERLYAFIRRQAAEGHQVYIVCPAVEEQEDGGAGLKAAAAHAARLQAEIFSDLRVALIHGKMKGKDKEAVMSAFSAGDIQVLVSTTVIEVGVDVPNATLMVVENAERFGLSQLHQLRGRVGRGGHQSWCVLVSDHPGEETRRRLKALCATNDGFRIAQEDLKIRGPGDFFGARQHGLPQLRVADLAGDTRVLCQARDAARQLLEEDPDLSRPEHRPVLARVRSLFERNPDIFN